MSIREPKTTGAIMVAGRQITEGFAIINYRHQPGIIDGIRMLIDNNPEFGGIRSFDVTHFIIPVKLRKPYRPAGRAVKGASFDESIHGNTAHTRKVSAPNLRGESVGRAFVHPVGARRIGP